MSKRYTNRGVSESLLTLESELAVVESHICTGDFTPRVIEARLTNIERWLEDVIPPADDPEAHARVSTKLNTAKKLYARLTEKDND